MMAPHGPSLSHLILPVSQGLEGETLEIKLTLWDVFASSSAGLPVLPPRLEQNLHRAGPELLGPC